MYVEFLLDRFQDHLEEEAIVWNDKIYSYRQLLKNYEHCKQFLQSQELQPATIVGLEADFSPLAVAMLLSLVAHSCIVVPLTTAVGSNKDEFLEIAQVQTVIKIGNDESITSSNRESEVTNELLLQLKSKNHPGLVLFSSGSTGKSKAAVHDFVPLLEKFKIIRHTKRTISFLLFDHIGGLNTLLYTLSNCGCIVTVNERTPEAVCHAIEKHKVQSLPTTPTFINMILISGAYNKFDLSSLELVTYGTEVMPQSTLSRFSNLFPSIRLLQTYGLSEIGIMRSKSKSSDSLWVKIGGEGFETRVRDGKLEIKAQSAMLGYLNAPSPYTEDGWFITGDVVETDGEYFLIKGRASEIINVGGEKVYPAEVESVLQLMDGVLEVTVKGESSPITGQLVAAYVKISTPEDLSSFRTRMRKFCSDKLNPYKIPQKVIIIDAQKMYNDRYKKIRRW